MIGGTVYLNVQQMGTIPVVDEQAIEWLGETDQRTWRTFLLAAHEIDAALDRQLLHDAGMPHSHYAVLVVLSESQDRTMRMGQLAERLRFSPSRLAHAATRMEANGWIRREPCPDDARGQLAVLTDAGHAALSAAAPGHVALVRRLLVDPLSDLERRQLGDLLERMVAAVATAEE